jgi:hypothetical protein
MSRLSGWQRIGVVISVLWMVGFPIFLMVDTNRQASEMYQGCLRIAYSEYGPSGYLGDKPVELKATENRCFEPFNRMYVELAPKIWTEG